jgi:hypothetical protein
VEAIEVTMTEAPLTNGDARAAVFRLLDDTPGMNRDQLSEALGGTPKPRRCGELKAEWTALRASAGTPASTVPPTASGAQRAPEAPIRQRQRHPAPAADLPDIGNPDDRLEKWTRRACAWGLALIALAMSYSHTKGLVVTAGVSWPTLMPLTADLLMVVGWLCLRRHPRYPWAVLAVVVGFAGTLALNAIAARPELVSPDDVRLWTYLGVPTSAGLAVHLALKR